MKVEEKAIKQAMTVGFAIRVIEATGKEYIKGALPDEDLTEELLGKNLAVYAWACAQELMSHYPDTPSEPQPMDFPMISPIRPS